MSLELLGFSFEIGEYIAMTGKDPPRVEPFKTFKTGKLAQERIIRLREELDHGREYVP